MPEDMVGYGVGVQSSSSHIFAHVDAEVARGVLDEGLDEGGFDEEAVVAKCWDTSPETYLSR
mgnify:CR=1 FL=1